MSDGDFFETVTDRYGVTAASAPISSLRLAVLFAGVAMVSAVILTPILAVDGPARLAYGGPAYDPIVTGSVQTAGRSRVYTIRKSVLQDVPESICIIQQDGSTTGDC